MPWGKSLRHHELYLALLLFNRKILLYEITFYYFYDKAKTMKYTYLLLLLLLGITCLAQNNIDEKVKLELTAQQLENSVQQIDALKQEIKELQQKMDANKEYTATEIKQLKSEKQNIEWWLKYLGLPLAGLTLFSLLQLYFFKLPKLVKEVTKKRIEDRLVKEEEKIKDVRLSIIGENKKGNDLKEQLVSIGLKRDKMTFYDLADYKTVNPQSSDYIFINDIEDKLDLATIGGILTTFENENLKYFYYGPKRLPPEIFKKVKSVASTKDTLQSNLIKSIKV